MKCSLSDNNNLERTAISFSKLICICRTQIRFKHELWLSWIRSRNSSSTMVILHALNYFLRVGWWPLLSLAFYFSKKCAMVIRATGCLCFFSLSLWFSFVHVRIELWPVKSMRACALLYKCPICIGQHFVNVYVFGIHRKTDARDKKSRYY